MIRKIFFLFLILSAHIASGDNCDSIVICKYHSDYSGNSVRVNHFLLDSLHRVISINGNETFQYDSLGRIILHVRTSYYDSIVYSFPPAVKELYRFYNSYGGYLQYKETTFSGVNQLDSLANILYFSPGSSDPYAQRVLYSYTSFDSIYSSLRQNFDSTSMTYITGDSAVYIWEPGNLFRIGYHYDYDWSSGSYQLSSIDSSRYNSLGEIQMGFMSGTVISPGYLCYYINSCGVPYVVSYETMGGSSQDWATSYDSWSFDSLCRPVSYVGAFMDNTMGGYANHNGQYYYADCNHIFIYPDDISICPGQASYPNLDIYGGTGHLSYQWSPADSVSNDTIANPELLGVAPQVYSVTVTDEIGNTASYSMSVTLNTFTYSVTDAACQSCPTGSIQINLSNSANIISISPSHYQSAPGLFENLYPRTYFICSRAINCITCDSITVHDLTSSIEESKIKFLSISPNPFSGKIILRVEGQNFQSRSQWKLYESNGRLLNSGLINEEEVMIKTEDISNGIYFLQIIDEKESCLMKMIKN